MWKCTGASSSNLLISLRVFPWLFSGLQGLFARPKVSVAAGGDVLHRAAQGEGPGSTRLARSPGLRGAELRSIHAPRRFEAFGGFWSSISIRFLFISMHFDAFGCILLDSYSFSVHFDALRRCSWCSEGG